MSTIHLHQTTTSTPEQFPAALIEFGPGRHYDWADRTRLVMKTTDSNIWGGRSGHTYTLVRRPDGTTDVDAVVVREGKNLKGRGLGLVLGTVDKRVLKTAFENTVKASKPVTARGARE
jgi:hypothetical protein